MGYLYDPLNPATPEKVKADVPEFNFKCKDLDRLIVATIFIYDPHADLLKLFPNDFSRRKYEACIKAGFKLNRDGKFEAWLEDCMVGKNDDYNSAVVSYVTKFNIADLPAYVMYRDVFFGEIKTAMGSGDSKAKKEAMINVENARKQLNDLEKKLFTGEETLEMRNALYLMAEKQKLSLRPEHKAAEIERGELSIKDPYYGGK